jgi:hypothetical protein
VVTANLEYIWRPPYGDPEDWEDGNYIGVQKFLPDFVPVSICDVAVYNTLWPDKPILYCGKSVPPLDDLPNFDNLDSIQDYFDVVETSYPEDFTGRRPLQYYIDWYQAHNNIETAVEVDESDDDSCDLKPPASKRPKVMPGCN